MAVCLSRIASVLVVRVLCDVKRLGRYFVLLADAYAVGYGNVRL